MSTVNTTTTMNMTMTTANCVMANSNCTVNHTTEYYPVLLVVYSVVLLIGTISLSLTVHELKSTTSVTSIPVHNLIFTHFIFLLTVPFRIYYYANKSWKLSSELCKFISAMIHIHMYMSFVFYVIILITRLMMFWKKQVASIERVHALIASTVVWMVVLVATPVTMMHYGKNCTNNTPDGGIYCFQFGGAIDSPVQALNYIISTLIIVVAIVLTALQGNVLRVLCWKHRGERCTLQQDFATQLMSLFFALIMVICFIPYHMFRIYYITNIDCLQNLNELFLSLTTFNCLDMLTFLGRRTWSRCFPRKIF